MTYTIALPWPSSILSPNARVHWSEKARAAKSARHAAAMLTRAAIGPTKPRWRYVTLAITFCPPDRRRRDSDNLVASLKASCDGIADALGTDDAGFISTYAIGDPVPGGRVSVSLSEAELTR